MVLGRKKYFLLKALQRIGLFPCNYDIPDNFEVDCSEWPEADTKRLIHKHYDFINQSEQMLSINPELLHMAARSKFYSRNELLFNVIYFSALFFIIMYSNSFMKFYGLHIGFMAIAVGFVGGVAGYAIAQKNRARFSYLLYNEYKAYRRNPLGYLDSLTVSVNDYAIYRILGCSVLMLLVAFTMLTIVVLLLVFVFW